MDLKNLLKHMRGKAALVQGTRYEVGLDGLVHDVTPEHAERMLLCWKEWEAAGPVDPEPEADELDDELEDEPEADEDMDLESMDLDELKARADELEVAYGGKIGKATLIERIKEAEE